MRINRRRWKLRQVETTTGGAQSPLRLAASLGRRHGERRKSTEWIGRRGAAHSIDAWRATIATGVSRLGGLKGAAICARPCRWTRNYTALISSSWSLR